MPERHTHLTAIVLSLTISLLFTSCGDKKEKTADDFDGPEITIFEPDDNDIYGIGDTIFVSADVEDESELQDISVKLIYGTDTVLLWPDAPVILGNIKSYTIDDWEVNTLGVTVAAVVRYEAMDKHDNATIKDVDIQLE